MSTPSPDQYIIGSDECGAGAWAGPLVVCGALTPPHWTPPKHLRDSKKMSTGRMHEVYPSLLKLPYVLVSVSNAEIDRCSLAKALDAAHAYVLRALAEVCAQACLVVDGSRRIPGFLHATYLPKADSIIPAVMAAAVIAKVNRDYLMQQYHTAYPQYGFFTNVGYGGNSASAHALALRAHGPSPFHRRSIAAVLSPKPA